MTTTKLEFSVTSLSEIVTTSQYKIV